MGEFFISYNSNDREWAEWIAWTLEESGYSVVIQAWDFRPGQNFTLKMSRAISANSRTVAVLSQSYLDATFTHPEWAGAFANDPLGAQRKLIPVRVGDCKPEGLLQTVIYIDLVGLTEAAAKAALLDGMHDRAKPAARPKFPGVPATTSLKPPPPFPGPSEGVPPAEVQPPPESIERSPVEASTAVEEETSEIQGEAHVERRYNIVLMGKTGVGKSALVNYLAGRPVVKVGIGKPVTKPGFHKREFDFHGIPATLFDSGGIELKDPEAWRRELRKELNMRGTDRPAEEWFHTIFYCVAASGSRIEDFEIEAIEAFLSENYRVVIVLTKADMVSMSKTKVLAGAIAKAIGGDVPIVDVCSERSERRDGTWEEPSGIDELRKVITDGFRASITGRLPDRCVKLLRRLVRRWQSEQRAYIAKHLTANNGALVFATLEQRHRKLIDDLSGRRAEQMLHDEVRRTLELYDVLAENIGTIDFKPMVQRRGRALKKLDVPAFAQSGGRLKRWANEYLGLFDKELRDADSASLTRFVEDVGDSLRDSIERWRPSIRKQVDRAAER